MVVEIVINRPSKELNKTFDYIVPKQIENEITIGARVIVPFNTQIEEGFVLKIKTASPYATKEIIRVESNYLTEQNIELAKLMARRYFCHITECIKLMLPPGTSAKVLENRIKEKIGNFIYLKKSIPEIEHNIEEKQIKSPKQIHILEFLKENEGIHIRDLELLTDTSKAIIKTLEKNGYIEIIEQQVIRNPFQGKKIERDKTHILTKEQHNAYTKVQSYIKKQEYKEFLLYGVTGSGKTEVYLQLIADVLKTGKDAIMLVPEISLTPQMVNRFIARFGEEKIAVLHSKLSVGERYDAWNKIKNKEVSIIIGARSAIFAPIQNPGIIIIDEEHDSSYKSEMAPRYHAKEIAKYIAKQNHIPLLLGSATPDICTFYHTTKEIELLKLTKRANKSSLPQIVVTDLREELALGNKTMISRTLYKEIEENRKQKRQTILFLNRRGFSTFVMCLDCGYTVKCKNCNISLTYHKMDKKLKCHYCGYETLPMTICPECHSKKIKYMGTGTQKLEKEIQEMFPGVSTIRMDIDTVTKKNSHEEILEKFKKENVNILIGTQMVVKGHHFPNVTLVGVILADSSLNLEDYRANEKTFQILTQVAGRAGRENLPGKVVIQTYNPDSYSIEYAKRQNYELFYRTEISLRKELKYPPFCDIILLNLTAKTELEMRKMTEFIYEDLKKSNVQNKMLIYKPVPSPIDKIQNKIRWRIIIKCKFDNTIINLINITLEKYRKKKLKNTTISIDINPANMM